MAKAFFYKTGIITIEIQAHFPEQFVNLLWKNGIQIKNIHKKNITTLQMEVNYRDFNYISDIARGSQVLVKVIYKKGLSFFMLRLRSRIALLGGIAAFVFLLYYLSGFIWRIDIQTDNNLPPYELRQKLIEFGVVPGIRKNNVNIYQLQDKIIRSSDNLMYLKAQIEGSRLIINAFEKTPPPSIVADNEPCNLVARKDGEVLRVFTSAGTPVVKIGDMVRSGQLIVKGEQGKEGSVYNVHAKGEVLAKTYYESSKEAPIKGIKKEQTGNLVQNYYIEILGRRIYLKNTLNKFKSYDKIEERNSIIKSDIYYETIETSYSLDPQKVIESISEELYKSLTQTFDKSVKVIDKKIISEPNGNNYKVSILVTAEENIALTEKPQ